MEKAAGFTVGSPIHIKDPKRMYMSEHSPIRTQLFGIEMIDIPTFVSVHFVRHKIGVEHYVKSNRTDRGGDGTEDRSTPVNHYMFINATALIYLSRKRLCSNASPETREVMRLIKEQIETIDPALAHCMIPECVYRSGCPEFKCCGKYPRLTY